MRLRPRDHLRCGVTSRGVETVKVSSDLFVRAQLENEARDSFVSLVFLL